MGSRWRIAFLAVLAACVPSRVGSSGASVEPDPGPGSDAAVLDALDGADASADVAVPDTPSADAQAGSREGCTPFEVASFNIQGGKGADDVLDLDRTARALEGADMVGLQEVDDGRPRSGWVSQAAQIASRLGHAFSVHWPAEDEGALGRYGNAGTSGVPVEDSGMFDLPAVDGKPPRVLGWLRLATDCGAVYVFVLHATLRDGGNDDLRSPQVDGAREHIDALLGVPPSAPYVFLGDFNVTQTSPVVAGLRGELTDALLARDPSYFDQSQRDFIFVAGGLDVVSARHNEDGASDHPAIFATVR